MKRLFRIVTAVALLVVLAGFAEIPCHIEGPLKGEIVRDDGKVRAHGQILEARIGKHRTAEPVKLELHDRNDASRCRNSHDNVRQATLEMVHRVFLNSDQVVVEEQPAGPGRAIGEMVNRFFPALEEAFQGLAWAGAQAGAWLPEKIDLPARQPEKPVRTFAMNFKMERVQLAKFAEGLQLKLPFDVTGELSFQVKAAIPLDTPADFKTYRVEGNFSVRKLGLAGLEVDEMAGRMTFAKGVLDLQDVTGRLGSPGQPGKDKLGIFEGPRGSS